MAWKMFKRCVKKLNSSSISLQNWMPMQSRNKSAVKVPKSCIGKCLKCETSLLASTEGFKRPKLGRS